MMKSSQTQAWEQRWVTITDASKILDRSRPTIHTWIRRGWIKANKAEGRTFIPLLTRRQGHVTENAPDFRTSAKK